MNRIAMIVVVTAVCGVVRTTEAQSDSKAKREAFAAEICKVLAEQDLFVAVERIESGDDKKTIARRYFYLVVDLYSMQKVDEMTAVGTIAVHYLLGQARQHAGDNAEAAAWFKNIAQMTSFNLASNLWPGWGDEGIKITSTQQAVGFDMAKLDLRLVREMKLPASKLATASWVVGIHHVAAGRYDEGKQVLTKAKEHAKASDSKETVLMVDGYIAIAGILEGKDLESARRHLAEVKQALEKLGNDDAKFYAGQHQDALQVLRERNKH